MNDGLKVTKYWWMIFRCFPPEPRPLWRLYMLSLCATLLLFSLAALSAWHTHRFLCKKLQITSNAFYCSDQEKSLKLLCEEAKKNSNAATQRKSKLEKIRQDDEDKGFIQPWSWFESEIKQLEKVIIKSNNYRITPISESFPWILILMLFSLISFLLIERLIILHAKWIKNFFPTNKLINWTQPQISFGFLIAFFMTLAEIFTSVLAKEKTWFGWDSFCVTPSAFIIKCISFISYGLVAATPFTVLWRLSDEKYLPKPNPLAEDGNFGAGRYVQFLQTWTLWLILFPSALGIIWFRYTIEMEPQFSPARLLHGTGVVALIAIIVYRLIKNAIILRFQCEDELHQKKYKAKDKLPTDPTIAFLGTAWWKLPATVATAFAVIWALLEGMGLTRHILSLIH